MKFSLDDVIHLQVNTESLCCLFVFCLSYQWNQIDKHLPEGQTKSKQNKGKLITFIFALKTVATLIPHSHQILNQIWCCFVEQSLKFLIQIQHIENEIELVTSWILWKIQLFSSQFGFHSIIRQVSLNMLWCSDWGTRLTEQWTQFIFLKQGKVWLSYGWKSFSFQRIHLKILD